MATIQAALYYQLRNGANIAALTTTIRPVGEVSSADGLPLITYQRIDDPPERYQGGDAGLRQARFQIDCYDWTNREAMLLRNAVRTDLNDFTGDMGDPADPVVVRRVSLANELDMVEEPIAAKEQRKHRIQMDFLVWYVE